MGERIVKLPDVGEGVAEAELVEWGVAVGDMVREDAVLASVMTDKATVEIPSPADGKVVWLGGEIGEKLAVGSPLVRIEVAGEGDAPEAEVEEGDSKTAAAEPGADRIRTAARPDKTDRAGAASDVTHHSPRAKRHSATRSTGRCNRDR